MRLALILFVLCVGCGTRQADPRQAEAAANAPAKANVPSSEEESVLVPLADAPVLDGVVGEQEWADSNRQVGDGLSVRLMRDGECLYLGVVHDGQLSASIDVAILVSPDRVIGFHRSQLGEEAFSLKDGKWSSEGFPGYESPETPAEKRRWEDAHSWLASHQREGTQSHCEYRFNYDKLGIGRSSSDILRLAVNLVHGWPDTKSACWPKAVRFQQQGTMLDPAKIAPHTWARLRVAERWNTP